jgi:hypothetical protein
VISLRWWLSVSMGLLASALVVGCGTLAPPSHRGVAPSAIAHAYQQGVRDAHAQLAAETGSDPRVTWTAPVVQEVWIPAQVVNGVFIPGHREWVVIHPAEWQRSSPMPARPAPAGASSNDRRRP